MKPFLSAAIPASDGIELRPLSHGDLPLALRLRNDNREKFGSTDVIAPKNHAAWFEKYLATDSDLMFVIWKNGTPVGTIAIYDIDLKNGSAEFGRMVVEASERRKHTAIIAADALIRHASDIGIHELALTVREENHGAIALYERLHFFTASRDGTFVKMLRRDWDGWQVDAVVGPIEEHWRSRSEIFHRTHLACEVMRRVKSDSKLLDVGCGSGLFHAALLLAGHRRDAYTGIDTSEAMLALARCRLPGSDFTYGDAYALKFTGGFFDAAIAFEVFMHLPEIETPIREMLRVAKIVLFTVTTEPPRKESFAGATFSVNPWTYEQVKEALGGVRHETVPISKTTILYVASTKP